MTDKFLGKNQRFQHWYQGDTPTGKTLFQVGMAFNGLVPWGAVDTENLGFSVKGLAGVVNPAKDPQGNIFFIVKSIWVLVYANNANSALCKAVMALGHNNFLAFSTPDSWDFDSLKQCRVMVAGESEVSKFWMTN